MPPIQLLLKLIDEAYKSKTWHGPNLRGSLRGVTAVAAVWRPSPKRHNIWEITLHAAYWKYAVRRRLCGDKRGSFPIKGSNWFVLPADANEAEWKAHLHLLDEMHRVLRDAIADMSPARLFTKVPGSKHTAAELIYGIACHDVYHAGQIQLLKRLLKAR